MSYLAFVVPRTGLEPARLAALAPETSASTIPPPGLCECKDSISFRFLQINLAFCLKKSLLMYPDAVRLRVGYRKECCGKRRSFPATAAFAVVALLADVEKVGGAMSCTEDISKQVLFQPFLPDGCYRYEYFCE